MTRFALLALGFSLAACTTATCDDVIDAAEECALNAGVEYEDGDIECSDGGSKFYACMVDAYNNSPCETQDDYIDAGFQSIDCAFEASGLGGLF